VLQTYIGGELHKFNKQTHFVFLASCEIQLLELPRIEAFAEILSVVLGD